MVLTSSAYSAVLLGLAARGALGAFHQHFKVAPLGWAEAAVQPSESAKTVLTLALRIQNLDRLESTLLAVSTPGSPDYGKFQDREELQATFGPSDDAVSSVTAWLEASGISSYQVDGAFVDFAVDVPTANQVFNASYRHYTNDGVTRLRTLSYSIPDDVQDHIAYLYPSTYFGKTEVVVPTTPAPTSIARRGRGRHGSVARALDIPCNTTITPPCVRKMYNIGNYTPQVEAGSRLGFASFLNQSAVHNDIAQYEALFDIPSQEISKVLIAGAVDNQDSTTPHKEANLDAQTILGLAAPLPVTEYMTGGQPPFTPNIDLTENTNEPYVPFLRYLMSKDNSELPQVISISYSDVEDTVPQDYATLACNLIGLQGLRGITVLTASGDNGLGAGCLAPDNKTVEFNAMFPSSCPWITSVGGTGAVSPENAWQASGGGFSRYFSRPSYQEAAVSSYLAQVDPETLEYYGQYADFSGRGFPDLAAHSAKPAFGIVNNGQQVLAGGTSASAPVVASVVALLNDARLRAGLPTLGWINPLVYASAPEAKALVDITQGFSSGCTGFSLQTGAAEPEGSGIVPGASFNATVGWDPVTGFGTPDFEKLRELVLSL